jgi:hypothetical protein
MGAEEGRELGRLGESCKLLHALLELRAVVCVVVALVQMLFLLREPDVLLQLRLVQLRALFVDSVVALYEVGMHLIPYIHHCQEQQALMQL